MPRALDAFSSPAVIAAIVVLVVLVVNDALLKSAWPGAMTGKLSDLAGLLFFPLVPVAIVEVLTRRAASRGLLAASIAVTGVVFASAELIPAVEEALEIIWGRLQPPGWSGRRVAFTADPTDLFALVALAGAWLIGRRSLRE